MEAHHLRPCSLHHLTHRIVERWHLDGRRIVKRVVPKFSPIGLQPSSSSILPSRVGWRGSVTEEIHVDWPRRAGAQLGDRIAHHLG